MTEETAKRYCTAAKKEKTKIIDEFSATTGYNRKYAIHVLRNSARIRITSFNNVHKESVHIIHRQRRKMVYVPIYDSDNGSELKNTQLPGWCNGHTITFTRSRPYKKNDNCFVEQKNDSVVRRRI